MTASIPVLIGCASVTERPAKGEVGTTPADLLARAGKCAIADANGQMLADTIDTVVAMRLFCETSPRFRTRLGVSANLPRSVADRTGLSPRSTIYVRSGGNTPQYSINRMADDIARGDRRAVLIIGGEALASQRAAEAVLPDGAWGEQPAGGAPDEIGDLRPAYSDHEVRNGVAAAIVGYPLIENVIRAACGRSLDDHARVVGELLAPFAAIAAENPLATRRAGHSANQIATPSSTNPYIGFPYTKLMNSNAYVDQAAAVIMTSTEHARALGVPEDRWVYLHGHADADDIWHFTDRPRLDRSPAIRGCVSHALDMAGLSQNSIDLFDLYSCFPSAIEVARQAIGLGGDDPRPLTVTGGLPFFGGPGNSYTLCAVAQMMTRLRDRRGAYGLVTGNGNILTKHSVGIYSTAPIDEHREAENGALQADIDSQTRVPLETDPRGPGVIESYTVVHAGGAPVEGAVLGRMQSTGQRFIARLPKVPAVLEDFVRRDPLGLPGQVSPADGHSVFTPGGTRA